MSTTAARKLMYIVLTLRNGLTETTIIAWSDSDLITERNVWPYENNSCVWEWKLQSHCPILLSRMISPSAWTECCWPKQGKSWKMQIWISNSAASHLFRHLDSCTATTALGIKTPHGAMHGTPSYILKQWIFGFAPFTHKNKRNSAQNLNGKAESGVNCGARNGLHHVYIQKGAKAVKTKHASFHETVYPML